MNLEVQIWSDIFCSLEPVRDSLSSNINLKFQVEMHIVNKLREASNLRYIVSDYIHYSHNL
jgi:hypothetical protein